MAVNRRHALVFLTRALASPALAQTPAMSRITAYAFSFAGLQGDDIRLADYAGGPILVVNTASLCGYTPQYAGLQVLWTRYRARGLIVIGVPSNDFGGQNPGGVAEIVKAAQGQYKTNFPLTAKAAVKGADAHPFYKWATLQKLAAPSWNFHKYLIGRDGLIKANFASAVEPTDPRLIAAIEKELGAERCALRLPSSRQQPAGRELNIKKFAKTLTEFVVRLGANFRSCLVIYARLPFTVAAAARPVPVYEPDCCHPAAVVIHVKTCSYLLGKPLADR